MTNYVLCCKMQDIRDKCDYAEMFRLLIRNDTNTKRAAVDSLQSILLKTDPSRLLEFDKKTFFIEGIDIVINEMLKSVNDGYIRGMLVPLAYSIMNLTNLCIVNNQIDDRMKDDIHFFYKKHL